MGMPRVASSTWVGDLLRFRWGDVYIKLLRIHEQLPGTALSLCSCPLYLLRVRVTGKTDDGRDVEVVVPLSCIRLCDPMDCSTPGPPVHHQLLEFTQTHVH